MSHDIRLISPVSDDVVDIISLFVSSDPGHNRSKAYYKYTDFSGHDDTIRVIAKNKKGMVVGHYSILLLEFGFKNKLYKVGYAQQAIIHNKYRNLKLISELHEFAIGKASDKKLDFIFAFSNDNFLKIKTNLFGWHDLGSFYSDVIDLHMINFKVNHEIEELKKFEHGFKLNQNKVSIIKSSNYLNHRLLKNPIDHYKTFIIKSSKNIVTGYISLKFYKSNNELVGHFIDFEANSNSMMESLVAKAKEYLIFYGVHKVIFWNRTEYQELFSPYITGKGFSSNFIIKDIVGNREILNKELWSLPMILSDTF
jgi:hypothetical protein